MLGIIKVGHLMAEYVELPKCHTSVAPRYLRVNAYTVELCSSSILQQLNGYLKLVTFSMFSYLYSDLLYFSNTTKGTNCYCSIENDCNSFNSKLKPSDTLKKMLKEIFSCQSDVAAQYQYVTKSAHE